MRSSLTAPDSHRLIPDCKVSLNGTKLDLDKDASLTRVEVDLDVDLFGQCTLVFNDPKMSLINGEDFKPGVAIKVELGFASKLRKVFEGEVVTLEPQFRRDQPPSLHVVCHESLHRLALSQMTRSFNDVDDSEIVTKIAQENGLSGEGPAGTKEHILQGNISDAAFLRRIAQKHGNHVRIEGKKLIVGPPPKGEEVTVTPGDGLKKMTLRIKAGGQVSEVSVHGWDPKTKKEIVGKHKAYSGEIGAGSKAHGEGTLSVASHEHPPADTATAEAMAKGRMRKLAEGFVNADVQMIGNAGVLPGFVLNFDKLGEKLDGTYRVEHARHEFSKHGFLTSFKAVRVGKKKSPKPAKASQSKSPGAPAPGAPPPSTPEQDAAAAARSKDAPGARPGDPSATPASAKPASAGAADGAPAAQAQVAGSTLDLTWETATGFCGDKIKLKGVSTKLPDGPVTVTLTAKQGSSPQLKAFTAQLAAGKFEQEWQIANVDFGTGPSALSQVAIEATAGIAEKVTSGTLTVKGRSDAPTGHYNETRTWSGFGVHAHFDQKIEKFKNQVDVTFNIIKGYGATWVNMNAAGMTGTTGGVPWAGYRWGRASSPRSMSPDQYWDGTAWVAMPTGFTVTAALYGTSGFYVSGSGYASPGGATYPERFADYDFNSAGYTTRRADWISDTHTRWTDCFRVRRKTCPSKAGVNCCAYSVEVKLTFNVVTSHSAGVVLVCAGPLRSNTDTWFMDDDRIAVAAHEAGHYMDNPDEYTGGALDTSVNGDGAVNGIDADCLMGQNLSVVKKRHYHAFAAMARKLVQGAYGLDEEHAVVDK